MESEMKKDDGFAVTYTTGDVPTYTSAHYTTEMHGYYTDIDWQNGSLDPSRSMYTRQEMPTIPFYPGYQTVTHADIYPGSNLWHSADNSLQVAADANISHAINVRRENARSGTTSTGRPKRRRTQSLTQRRAANVRERRRMFQLNEAFDALRKKLPAFNYEKRLSRIETLRLAMTYISFMQEVTTGADPKHVKLLSYQTEDSNHAHDLSLHQNGCHSPISENDIDIGIHGEHVVENVTLTPVDVQPQSELKELQSVSAVHVELLPSVPVKISLPATNLEVLTEEPPQSFAEEQSVSDE